MNDSISGSLPASVEGKSQGPRLLLSPISLEPKARLDVIMTHTPMKHRDARKANVHSRSNPESGKTKLRMHVWSSSTAQFSGSRWKEASNSWGESLASWKRNKSQASLPMASLGGLASLPHPQNWWGLQGQADQRARAIALVAEPGGKGSLEGKEAIFLPRKTNPISDS